MHEDRGDPKEQCEVVEARHVEDSIGYTCEKTAEQECDDCEAAICDLHAELCDFCRKVFCGSCFKESHARPAAPILDERIQKRPA